MSTRPIRVNWNWLFDISDKQMFVFLSTNMNIVNKVLCNW